MRAITFYVNRTPSRRTTGGMTNPKIIDPDEIAAKAEQQKKAAREPQQQHGKPAPKEKPVESGKPVWDKPHSS